MNDGHWVDNEAIEFTQELQKPDTCTCHFPTVVSAGITGHAPGCLVFDSLVETWGIVAEADGAIRQFRAKAAGQLIRTMDEEIVNGKRRRIPLIITPLDTRWLNK